MGNSSSKAFKHISRQEKQTKLAAEPKTQPLIDEERKDMGGFNDSGVNSGNQFENALANMRNPERRSKDHPLGPDGIVYIRDSGDDDQDGSGAGIGHFGGGNIGGGLGGI
ncbi:hypothetical protein LPJ70_001507 [Coemansia sp. RSA 2708]|nr:hypothetical protein LPJ70_001507 [Coemansia sp. RSA 2708]KAJ2303060.1 hypothetical protein IWW54_005844 [Coemansia sp. RSA 2705]KAJ2309123.1 hypothetical protein IWW52_005785 [Coemansia sp. RSA 2704]